MLLEMRFDSVQHGIALCLCKRPSKEFHHTSVSIHAGEPLPVGVAPRAQDEALGGDSHLVHDTQIGLIVALIFLFAARWRDELFKKRFAAGV